VTAASPSVQDEARLDAIATLLARLLGVLDALEAVGRALNPPALPSLAGPLAEPAAALRAGLSAFQALDWPTPLAAFRDQTVQAATAALRACDGLAAAAEGADGVRGAYRAMRQLPRAAEALYPLAAVLPAVSRWFLEPALRDDPGRLARLATPTEGSGVHHVANETTDRGGFSVYVPEDLPPDRPAPLVMALHGGAGHGRLFLWSWLRAARSRGAILVAPTSTGDTWSLMDPEIDSAHLAEVLAAVAARWPVDPARRLLAGMSDGGTFTLLSGLQEDSPFTHLAPFAASFHPLLLTMAEPARVRGLPVHLVHGALDWMFPVTVARTADRALRAAGAAVTYREVTDLSHVFPTDMTPEVLDWFGAHTTPRNGRS